MSNELDNIFKQGRASNPIKEVKVNTNTLKQNKERENKFLNKKQNSPSLDKEDIEKKR
jgi:hypothetical protein